MKLIGIPLRMPRFNEITASTVMAVGLWVALLGAMRVAHIQIDAIEAGALLLVVLWSCLGARVGIHVGMGQRHLVANLLVSATLLGLYKTAVVFVV